MRLVTFICHGKERLGALSGKQVIDLNYACKFLLNSNGEKDSISLANEMVPSDVNMFLAKGDDALSYAKQSISFIKSNRITHNRNDEKIVYSLDEIKLIAVTPRPGKIICIGLNYSDHCKEIGTSIPDYPTIISKFNNAVIGTDDYIIVPDNTNHVDYEAELAFIIGKKAIRVKQEDAMDVVAGYTIFNDVTARDIQHRENQWTRSKSFDTFAPIGPELVTKDEIDDPDQLNIKLTLNGELLQESNTGNMAFKIPYLISFISENITLEPGDIIATGTPAGVGVSRNPQVRLKENDEIVIEVEEIGRLRNKVKSE